MQSSNQPLVFISEVEIREAEGGPRLSGIVVPEGRAAVGGRAEVWAPNSAVWAQDGIAIRAEHRGPEVARAQPVRHPGGEVRISVKATPEIRAAFAAGRKYLSSEFHSLAETRTAGGVREIQRAFIEAAALVPSAEYGGTRAEIRSQDEVTVWL